jgi:hypothetical protein
MKLTTTRRGLSDSIDGITGGADVGDVSDALRLPLAQALAAVARLVDNQPEGHDRELILHADVGAESSTVSIRVAGEIAPPAAEAPYVSSHIDDIDRERQGIRTKADEAEAERIRALLER